MPPEAAAKFQEANLRTTQIKDLGLTIEGTRLEPLIARFEEELRQAGITRIKPPFYLSTEWGVPFNTISIALPFYLAHPELVHLQAEEAGLVEGVSDADILRYLRHEMGHVINYAYRLYEQEEWINTFGSITQPYIEEYRPKPFSRRYVRHLPGWYAQKHPDEDWAETFAVWMSPPPATPAPEPPRPAEGLSEEAALNSEPAWKKRYAGWPTALAKLEYCDRTMRELKDRDPIAREEELDEDVSQLDYSVHEYYSRLKVGEDELPAGLEGALTAIFEDFDLPEQAAGGDGEAGSGDGQPDVPRKPASALIRRIERDVGVNVFRWTGHFPERTRALLRHLAQKADELNQVYPTDRESEMAVAVTALVTALAMNYVHRGDYLP